jgi:ribonucleotide reductase class II
MSEFRPTAPSAPAVFYRSYSRRKDNGQRESYAEAITRTVTDLANIGSLTAEQKNLALEMGLKQHAFPSGRALWVAGTDWAKKPENYSGYYNCHGGVLNNLRVFGRLMNLAMCGTGTGVLLEKELVEQLPVLQNKIDILDVLPIGQEGGNPRTELIENDDHVIVCVGDSRQGWVDAYQGLINAAYSDEKFPDDTIRVILDLGQIRPSGKKLKGFGGTANPAALEDTFRKVVNILNKGYSRRLTSVECCLLVDEAAACVVAGNIRRSAGIRLFSSDDEEAKVAKLGLYSQDEQGNWRVDPERESLRLANHTVCYHHKPSYEEILDAVSKQYYSGEGAIQYSPEAIARSNADLLDTPEKKQEFLDTYTTEGKQAGRNYLAKCGAAKGLQLSDQLLDHCITRYSANPCHEIIGNTFQCNLGEVHLNTIDPQDTDTQHKAFYSTGLLTATLLQHKFPDPELQFSREVDPIVAVCLSGLFDFFVHAFGVKWLKWVIADRPDTAEGRKFRKKEIEFLTSWKESARQGVSDYCTQAGIKMPNRYTAVQPSGSKALLTGASSGWHPPKAAWFIRRITFGVDDPLVSALRDWGYNVVPAQSARDEQGNLLDDISDPRVREVLVEIPTKVSWAELPGVEDCDLSQIPATSQMDLYMQVQRHYSTHTTSATIEFRENEIEDLAKSVHTQIQEDRGYIGVAMLARFDDNATFPRLPFEPITKEEYERLDASIKAWRQPEDEELGFLGVLNRYDTENYQLIPEAACTSTSCIAKADADEREGKA